MTQTPVESPHVLHLASWYPSAVHGTLGNFVRRHVEAISTSHRGEIWYAAPTPPAQTLPENSREKQGDFLECITYFRAQKPVVEGTTRALLQMAEHVNDSTFDVIHLHVAYPAGKAARILAKRWGIPLIVTEHWTAYHTEQRHRIPFWRKWSMRSTLRQAQAICPVSNDLAKSIGSFASIDKEERFYVVPNVVDTSLFQPQTSAAKAPSSAFQWLHISSLDDDQKNISGLIRAIQLVRNQSDQFHVQVIGDGDPAPHQELVNTLGLQDCITVHGEIGLDEVAEKMRNADALLLFSRYENFPCVIPEAWASGIPVLSTDVGGIREHLTPIRGELVESENEPELAHAMHRWMQGSPTFNDAELRSHAVDHFSVEAVAQAYSHIYSEALQSVAMSNNASK
jgi:glycosyltransferase involved in cell wall biosynthesis